MSQKSYICITIILFVFYLSCVCASALTQNGFDQICEIYSAAMASENFTKLETTEKVEWINNQIERSVSSEPALRAYYRAMEVDPKDKYILFQKSAEHVLNRSWDCSAMQKIVF